MSALHATLYPVVLILANTVAAIGAYVLTGPHIALLLGVVALLLVVGSLGQRRRSRS